MVEIGDEFEPEFYDPREEFGPQLGMPRVDAPLTIREADERFDAHLARIRSARLKKERA